MSKEQSHLVLYLKTLRSRIYFTIDVFLSIAYCSSNIRYMGQTKTKEERIRFDFNKDNVTLTYTDTVTVYSEERVIHLVAGMLFMQIVQFLAIIYTNRRAQSK